MCGNYILLQKRPMLFFPQAIDTSCLLPAKNQVKKLDLHVQYIIHMYTYVNLSNKLTTGEGLQLFRLGYRKKYTLFISKVNHSNMLLSTCTQFILNYTEDFNLNEYIQIGGKK